MSQYISVFRKPKVAEATQWNGTEKDAARIIDWVLAKNENAQFVPKEDVGGIYDRDLIVISDGRGRSVLLPDYWLVFEEETRFTAMSAVHFSGQYERTVVNSFSELEG